VEIEGEEFVGGVVGAGGGEVGAGDVLTGGDFGEDFGGGLGERGDDVDLVEGGLSDATAAT